MSIKDCTLTDFNIPIQNRNIKVVVYIISQRHFICEGYECQISRPFCFEFRNVWEGTLSDLGAKRVECLKDAGNQIKEDDRCERRSTHGTERIMHSNFWWKNLKESGHLHDLGIDGMRF
jgi:hypothetical protein